MRANSPVRLYTENETVVLAVRIYLDIRTDNAEQARDMIFNGIRRVQTLSPYQCGGREVSFRVDISEADAFSLDAVNVRVYDITPVNRHKLSPKYNVSRAYIGSAHRDAGKLARRIAGLPDMVINLGGRDITCAGGMTLMETVVMHEFMHVISFRDKYRGKKGKKLNASVQDRDIMYRTGSVQRPMEYHIRRLERCARKGKLPIRWV